MTLSTNASVSIAELLNRKVDPVYGPEAQLLVEGYTVLVTGAGGSIGSEIVRQLLHLGAGKVVCVDNNEYALYLLERELKGTALLTDDTLVLADIQDRAVLDAVFTTHQPQLVFHAAACKHLTLLEKSPTSAVLTNVLGTNNVVDACIKHCVKRFVNISTDKAANPTSVLGMSKRLAEVLVKQHAGRGTKIASVRFGNVFGSRGSFAETFMWQIANDREVTITDPAITRYFMTIPQAAGLVIEAAVMANGGNTYVLDMGESYRIVEIVRRYAKLIGANVRIVYTGLRQGEKLDEELYDPRETRQSTRHRAISTVRVDEGDSIPADEIMALCAAAQRGATPVELYTELTRLNNANTLPSTSTVEV